MGWKDIAGAGASIVGDVFGIIEARKDRAENARINESNNAMSRDFAQNGLQWRVEDARKAGIHPLAALGMQGVQPGTASVFNSTGSGQHWSNMGQNISRAINATRSNFEREMQSVTIDSAKTDLAIKKLELDRMRQVGPGFPGPTKDPYLSGQGDVLPASLGGDSRVIDTPLRRIVSDPQNPAKEAGAIPDYNFARSGDSWVVVPAADVKQRIEDDWLAEQQWKIRTYRNILRGNIRLPNGMRAVVNPLTGDLIQTDALPYIGRFRRMRKEYHQEMEKWR